ncbi:MAG: small ribosomal subunit biogenesis GTPase RsgA [Gammaproteobacteria bacterium]|nr:small ribosomal subunit biogenesis GTPase RsgA [Gammaproteobacteria bacterium]
MAKRQKLTLQQKRRLAERQQKKLETDDIDESGLSEAKQGLVISRFGEQVDVVDENKNIFRVYLRQNLGSCVSGDQVMFRTNDNDSGVVEAIEPRFSELTRPTPHSGIKTIVANIDKIFVVVAPFPDYSSLILDRYLVACELARIESEIIFNKTDLMTDEQLIFFEDQMKIYQSIGYVVHKVSCKTSNQIESLKQRLLQHKSIFVGQSGVGKSSLINSLLPEAEILTGAVSENSRLGTHTTTASRLYFLPDKGYIIDSPGVREFGLSHLEPEQLIDGFIDLKQQLNQCKFRNCRHLGEKGCSLNAALETQEINAQRLSNYQKIYQSIISK